jgi:hypothetical protein
MGRPRLKALAFVESVEDAYEALEQAASLYEAIADEERDAVARRTAGGLRFALAELQRRAAAPAAAEPQPAALHFSASKIGALARAADMVLALRTSTAVTDEGNAWLVGAEEMEKLELAIQPFRAATAAAHHHALSGRKDPST